MKQFQARVYVKNGTSRVPHTVQLNAETSFSAQQMLVAQYGAGNIITIPVEVKGGSGHNPAPWMLDI